MNPQRDDFDAAVLFSESASRFIVEVLPNQQTSLEAILRAASVPFGQIGQVTDNSRLQIISGQKTPVDLPLAELKEAWQKPLRW